MPDDRFGVGASLLRREDDRHLHGRGQFVADVKLPGTMDVAFVRSPHAHARIRSITVPPEARSRVFTAADLPRVKPIRVVSHSTGAKSPPWPPLALEVHGFGLERFLTHSLELQDGFATAPERPGHGVEFDWQTLDSVRTS